MSIVIDKGIPYPGRPGGVAASILKMEIGDSFFSYNKNAAANALQAVAPHGKAWKFSQRREGNGFRVWRLA